MNGKIYELRKVHLSHGSETDSVFGDWVYSEYGKNHTQKWTFFIRDNGTMNLDLSCTNVFE